MSNVNQNQQPGNKQQQQDQGPSPSQNQNQQGSAPNQVSQQGGQRDPSRPQNNDIGRQNPGGQRNR